MNSKLAVQTVLSQRGQRSQLPPISDLMARAIANPNLISLAAGFVDQATLPVDATFAAFETLFANSENARAALQYGTTNGSSKLREILRSRLEELDGQSYRNIEMDQIVLTAGSNQFLHLVADVLLDPDDIVICAAPTYLVFMGILDDLGAQAYGIEMDADGMIPEKLDAAFEKIHSEGNLSKVKSIYLVSYFDNPTGMTTTLSRRKQIVEIANKWSINHRIYVIEDIAYRELRYDAMDLPTMFSVDEDRETVILAGTFSKSLSPGIRVGWGILPDALVAPLTNLKGNLDFGSPHLNQAIVANLIEANLFDSHVQKLCTNYAKKQRAMTLAAEKYIRPLNGVTWFEPKGGLYLWLELDEAIDTGPNSRLFEIAVEKGVLYVPGEFCYPKLGAGVKTNTIRLSFGVQSVEKIDEGMKLLAEAMSEAS